MATRSLAPAPGSPKRNESPSRAGQAPLQSSEEAFQLYSKTLAQREAQFVKKMDQLNAKFMHDIPSTPNDPEMKQHYDLYAKLMKEHTEKFARKAKEHTDLWRTNHPANPNPPPKK
jgi:hypothetical protein